MTTEDDFQRALDANPDDHQTRLVFSDWLQERCDPRAEGYRALGALRKRPRDFNPEYRCGWCSGANTSYTSDRRYAHCVLPARWYDGVRALLHDRACRNDPWWIEGLSRRELEDAAALAFAKHPAERRA
jgi:uncharacterized protein (TIGR02996 family)